MEHVREQYRLSGLGMLANCWGNGGAQRYWPMQRTDEDTLTRTIISFGQ